VTTNSGVLLDERFDIDEEGESDFDDVIDGDEYMADENMWFDFIDFNVSPLIYVYLVNIMFTAPLLFSCRQLHL
jgi:hypothetical protein